MATKPSTLAQLQVALKAAQAQAADTEAAASKSLAEAADTMSRLKLAATAASDRDSPVAINSGAKNKVSTNSRTPTPPGMTIAKNPAT